MLEVIGVGRHGGRRRQCDVTVSLQWRCYGRCAMRSVVANIMMMMILHDCLISRSARTLIVHRVRRVCVCDFFLLRLTIINEIDKFTSHE